LTLKSNLILRTLQNNQRPIFRQGFKVEAVRKYHKKTS
jgi:hypothetical protein